MCACVVRDAWACMHVLVCMHQSMCASIQICLHVLYICVCPFVYMCVFMYMCVPVYLRCQLNPPPGYAFGAVLCTPSYLSNSVLWEPQKVSWLGHRVMADAFSQGEVHWARSGVVQMKESASILSFAVLGTKAIRHVMTHQPSMHTRQAHYRHTWSQPSDTADVCLLKWLQFCLLACFISEEEAGDGAVVKSIPEDPSLAHSTQVRWLIAACNSRSGGSNALFWPPWALHTNHAHTFRQANT